ICTNNCAGYKGCNYACPLNDHPIAYKSCEGEFDPKSKCPR
uniref:Proteinase inhibitor IIB (Fragments) n=1 Tax=Solanum tuberosum TaxID=4113 RepID=IP2B_SOLTU|nr:RecName: Full=Proteinase inhibitor IIB [Solanum tuberosum]